MLTIKLDYRDNGRFVECGVSAGDKLQNTIEEAKIISAKIECDVEFIFNNVSISVSANSNAQKLCDQYHKAISLQYQWHTMPH